VVPQYQPVVHRVAYWDMFGHPKRLSKYGVSFDTWWVDPAKLAALPGRRRS
jgi:microcin C transport system substrate-binding protein